VAWNFASDAMPNCETAGQSANEQGDVMQKLSAEEAFKRAVSFIDSLGINVTPSVERQVLALVLSCEERDGVSWPRCTAGLNRRFPALQRAFERSVIHA
jgi:hypothetical protein